MVIANKKASIKPEELSGHTIIQLVIFSIFFLMIGYVIFKYTDNDIFQKHFIARTLPIDLMHLQGDFYIETDNFLYAINISDNKIWIFDTQDGNIPGIEDRGAFHYTGNSFVKLGNTYLDTQQASGSIIGTVLSKISDVINLDFRTLDNNINFNKLNCNEPKTKPKSIAIDSVYSDNEPSAKAAKTAKLLVLSDPKFKSTRREDDIDNPKEVRNKDTVFRLVDIILILDFSDKTKAAIPIDRFEKTREFACNLLNNIGAGVIIPDNTDTYMNNLAKAYPNKMIIKLQASIKPLELANAIKMTLE